MKCETHRRELEARFGETARRPLHDLRLRHGRDVHRDLGSVVRPALALGPALWCERTDLLPGGYGCDLDRAELPAYEGIESRARIDPCERSAADHEDDGRHRHSRKKVMSRPPSPLRFGSPYQKWRCGRGDHVCFLRRGVVPRSPSQRALRPRSRRAPKTLQGTAGGRERGVESGATPEQHGGLEAAPGLSSRSGLLSPHGRPVPHPWTAGGHRRR